MKLSSRLFLALSIAPLVVAQTQFETDVLAMNPLGFWPLHGNANDASSHANNGTLRNGVQFTGFVGPLGIAAAPAAVFTSAQNQFVALSGPGSSGFNLGGLHALTAMAWIRTENQGLGFMAILGKADPVANVGWAIGIDNGDVGGPPNGGRFSLIFFVGDQLTLDVETTVAVTDGGWHLVSATYDGSGAASGVRLYIDGIGMATTTLFDKISSGSILNSTPLTIGGAINGDSQFEGNINEAAVFGTALTPAQNLQLAEDAPQFRRILSQFVFGDGWYSAIYFTNAGTATLSFPVSFTNDNGSSMNVPSISGSSKTITLPPGGSAVIEAPNVGSRVEGYVSVVLPIGVTGYGVFRQSVAGIADQEAVVPLGPANAQFQALLYDETNFITGVAIVNPTSVVTTVVITVTDIDGNVIATSSPQVIQPFSKIVGALRSFPGLSQVAGHQGTAQFAVTSPTNFTGAVAVLGLRFKGSAFTSIPAFGKPGI